MDKFVPCREKTDIKLLNYYIQKTKPKNNIFCKKKVKKNNIKLMNELTLLLLDNQMNDEFDKYLKEIDFLRRLYLV